jgi:hypothetical protein
MAIKVGSRFKCAICGKIFPEEIACDMHRDKEHKIIYVPFEATDLEHLRQFLFFKNEKLLTPSLVRTITQYATRSAKAKMISESNGEDS